MKVSKSLNTYETAITNTREKPQAECLSYFLEYLKYYLKKFSKNFSKISIPFSVISYDFGQKQVLKNVT